MKRIFVALITLILLAGMIPAALAEGSGWYVVDSTSPYGYAYLYSAASDRDEISRNLGKLPKGRVVYVLNYYGGRDGKYNYCYVQTQSGERGYMHDSALQRTNTCNWSETSEGWYRIASTSPKGYAYLYSGPSDRDELSYNKGRHENGEMVYVVDYNGGQDGPFHYCLVRTAEGETGYMHESALVLLYPDAEETY